MFFEGFSLEYAEVRGQRIRLRRGGEGPPLLLLHGNPQTHAMWHKLAPLLAKRFTCYLPDIRGYGFSSKPPASPDSAAYAKREYAADLAALMTHYGHERFRVVSHDRGARVAHRLALDFPGRVEKLCTMDIIPTLEHFERADMAFAMGYYHWFWLAQPRDRPERMILRDVEDWFDLHTAREPKDKSFFNPDARADYLAALHLPDTVMAICEDYRAATGIDLVHDRESRAAGVKVQCPMLALWGAKGSIPKWYDALAIWQQSAAGPVSGGPVNSGHYLAEEAPEEVMAYLEPFL
jgi:haloacetate dehalogenase